MQSGACVALNLFLFNPAARGTAVAAGKIRKLIRGNAKTSAKHADRSILKKSV